MPRIVVHQHCPVIIHVTHYDDNYAIPDTTDNY